MFTMLHRGSSIGSVALCCTRPITRLPYLVYYGSSMTRGLGPDGIHRMGTLLDLYLVTHYKLISSRNFSLPLCPVYNYNKNPNQFGHNHEIYHWGCISPYFYELYCQTRNQRLGKQKGREEKNLYIAVCKLKTVHNIMAQDTFYNCFSFLHHLRHGH